MFFYDASVLIYYLNFKKGFNINECKKKLF